MALFTGERPLLTIPPISIGLIFVAPRIRAQLILVAPPTSIGLISVGPRTGGGLTSTTLYAAVGRASATPSTRVRLTLAGLFSGVKYILAKTETTVAFLASQVMPLSFMTRQTTKTRFLVHPIITSPSKTAGATPFTVALKAYLLSAVSWRKQKKNTSAVSSKR